MTAATVANIKGSDRKFNRILLIDIECERTGQSAGQLHSFWVHHPIGLLYLVSSARESFPDIEFRVFHTATVDHPQKAIEALMAEFLPDMVGLRALSIAQESFKKTAELIRKISPQTPLIAGGPYPSSSYKDILLSRLVDLVVLGEGEQTFIEIIGNVRKKGHLSADIAGTAVLDVGQIKCNQLRPLINDLNRLPFPDYSYINLNEYAGLSNHAFQSSGNSAFICSSRGCPYGCFYCHQLFGKKIRRRSPQNVVAEMREHVDKRGIRNFIFVDDLFNVPMPIAKETLGLIIKELPGVKINFPNGLRADQIDEELIELFEKAGTMQMAVAVETASPRMQKVIGKNLSLDKAKKAIQAASEKFIVCCLFMVGFPTETYEEAMETIGFAEDLIYVAQPVLSILRVYSGTAIFKMLDPTPEQIKKLAGQEREMLQPKLFGEMSFYGDMFPEQKVPLRGKDIQRLRLEWLRRVIANPDREANGHLVLKKHLNQQQIIEFYRNFHDNINFGQRDYHVLSERLERYHKK